MTSDVEPKQPPLSESNLAMTAWWAYRLSEIERWQEEPNMMHRTNLVIHSLRVNGISSFITDLLREKGISVNEDKVHDLAIHHDDPERFTGDISSPIKEHMTESEKVRLRDAEERASLLVKTIYFPKVTEQTFKDIQSEYQDQKTTEAQVAKAADRLDALGEVLNEMLCGNQNRDFWEQALQRLQRYLQEFDKYKWWNEIKTGPKLRLSELPQVDAISLEPQVLFNRLTSRDAIRNLATDQKLPQVYRTWIDITLQTFPDEPEKYLFPGWYRYLWDKWGYRKDLVKVKW